MYYPPAMSTWRDIGHRPDVTPVHAIWPMSRPISNRMIQSEIPCGFREGWADPAPMPSQRRYEGHPVRLGPNGWGEAAGFWIGIGFRPYIDTQLDVFLKVARLIATSSNAASDDDLDSPANIAMGSSIRAKLRISRRVRPRSDPY